MNDIIASNYHNPNESQTSMKIQISKEISKYHIKSQNTMLNFKIASKFKMYLKISYKSKKLPLILKFKLKSQNPQWLIPISSKNTYQFNLVYFQLDPLVSDCKVKEMEEKNTTRTWSMKFFDLLYFKFLSISWGIGDSNHIFNRTQRERPNFWGM